MVPQCRCAMVTRRHKDVNIGGLPVAGLPSCRVEDMSEEFGLSPTSPHQHPHS